MITPASNKSGNTTYRAASIVAKTVEEHFIRHFEDARQRGEQNLAPEPAAHIIEEIINVAFWASLRREEGQQTKVSLAFLPPDLVEQPVIFAQRLPLRPGVLTKIAPGVERPGIYLGVWVENNELFVWGTTNEIRNLCFVLDVSEPGLLVIKHRRFEGFGKFTNIAVLNGDKIKIVDKNIVSLPDCPELLTSLLGFTSSNFWNDSLHVMVQLAVSMRAHKRGGSLLVVTTDSDSWRDSIIHPIQYAIQPSASGITRLLQQSDDEKNGNMWQGNLQHEVNSIAGLTAIDGATIISNKYELLAFGAKIGRINNNTPIEKIVVTEPVVGSKAAIIHPSQAGGTRHFSAAQFIHDQHDAMALVASQDGRFTIFSWSPCEGMVHAHRIDTLLL